MMNKCVKALPCVTLIAIAAIAMSVTHGRAQVPSSHMSEAQLATPKVKATKDVYSHLLHIDQHRPFAPAVQVRVLATPQPQKKIIRILTIIQPPKPHEMYATNNLSPAVIAGLITSCAPDTNHLTQAAVIVNESSGNQWALHDNNSGKSYQPSSYDDAVQIANDLIARNAAKYGASDSGVDVGIGQINSTNFNGLGVNAADMLHPCQNLRISSRMIAKAYHGRYAQLSQYHDPERDIIATKQALEIYNSGHAFGDERYVQSVLSALHSPLVARMQLESFMPQVSSDVSDLPKVPSTAIRKVVIPPAIDEDESEESSAFVHVDVFRDGGRVVAVSSKVRTASSPPTTVSFHEAP